MKILVSNVGSTSLKFKLYEMPEEKVLCTGYVERVGSLDDAIFGYANRLDGYSVEQTGCCVPDYTEGIGMFTDCMCGEHGVLEEIGEIRAVGFKTVAARGFNGVHELTGEVMEAMRAFLPVAPAHNTAYLEAIGCFEEMLPEAKKIGVFETAFHQTIPAHRYLYSVPYEWYEKYGVRKLGYHGASHSYAASVLEQLFGSTGKAVTCHMGGSGSLCAIEDGKSVDTSFGMSLQIGLPQNNRAGDFDPYIIRYLEAQGLSEDDIFGALTSKSGFLGMSGVSKDLRYILKAAEEGNERAKLTIDHFVDQILHYIGAYAAKMGGLDNLVFTGGIGEKSAFIREAVCRRLAFLGLAFDRERNESVDRAALCSEITADGSKVRAFVIPADEEIIVARRTFGQL